MFPWWEVEESKQETFPTVFTINDTLRTGLHLAGLTLKIKTLFYMMLLPCPRQYAKCFTYFISFNSCDNPRKKLMPRNLNSSLPQIEVARLGFELELA